MILYYAATQYQLLCCILHRIKYNNDSRCFLVTDCFLSKCCNYFDRIQSEKFFDEVYSISFLAIKNKSLNQVIEESEKIIMNELPILLEEMDQIYILAAHCWFGIYVTAKKLSFAMFEECNGILSKLEKLQENVRNSSHKQDTYANNLGLYDGNSDLISTIFCSKKNKVEIFENPKVIAFDVMVELEELPKEKLNSILSIFTDEKSIHIPNNSLILLTQHFANLSILDWGEQEEIYKILIEYFAANDTEIIIKPHPADIMRYEEMFHESIVIRNQIPSELIPFMCRTLPKTIMTVSSTGIDTISYLFEQVINFDFEFEQCYPIIHTYYLLLKQFEQNFFNNFHFYELGTNKKILNNLNRYSDIKTRKILNIDAEEQLISLSEKSIVFIDDFYSEDIWKNLPDICELLNKNIILIFLNSKKKYNFYNGKNKDIFNYLILEEIFLKKEEQENLIGRVYIFKKGELKMSNTYKELYLEDSLAITKMVDAKEMQAQILMGMLKATEKRLSYYIERESELLKLIEGK